MSNKALAREMFRALGDMIEAQGPSLGPESKLAGRRLIDLILSLA